MSQEDTSLISVMDENMASFHKQKGSKRTLHTSRRVRLITNLTYLISTLDFLVHFAIVIELGLFHSIHQYFEPAKNITTNVIELCHLPILDYLPFHLSNLNIPILCLSIFGLIISFQALSKSSILFYRFYMATKFFMTIGFLSLYLLNITANLENSFVHSSIVLPNDPQGYTSNTLDIEPCGIYIRENLALRILSIFDAFIFCMAIECSTLFAWLKVHDAEGLPVFQKLDRSKSELLHV